MRTPPASGSGHLRTLTNHLSTAFFSALLLSSCSYDWSLAPTPSEIERNDPTGVDPPEADATVAKPTARDAGADADKAEREADASTMAPKPCPPGHREQRGMCLPDVCFTPSGSPLCDTAHTCTVVDGRATCTCAEGSATCADACVDLARDRKNCGTCGRACAGNLSCREGLCEQPVKKLVVGENNVCALLATEGAESLLRCWGDGSTGLFRDARSHAGSPTPREVVGITSVRDVALGASHRCALRGQSDEIVCWGYCGLDCGLLEADRSGDAIGELSSTQGVRSLSVVQQGSGYSQAFGSTPIGGSTCGLREDGLILCWGYRLYNGDVIDRRTGGSLRAPGDSYAFQALSSGFYHSCGVLKGGQVLCWGPAYSGPELGAPAPCVGLPPVVQCSTDMPRPVLVQRAEGGTLENIRDVSVGGNVSCALSTAGEVFCWGNNDSGMLGQGDTSPRTGAVRVPGLSKIEQVSVGGSGVCAVERGGQVHCWGSSTLPLENPKAYAQPQKITSLADVIEIRLGNGVGCARRLTGEVACWGGNEFGEVGDGTTISRSSPKPVVGLF